MAGQPRKRAKAAAADAAEHLAADAGPAPDVGPEQQPADQAPRPRRQRRSSAAGSTPQELGTDPAGPTRRSPKLRKIHDGLVQLFTLAGLGVGLLVDDYDGQVVVLNADRNARAWTDLAAQSPTVCKALEGLLMGSAWGAAIGTTAMTALPILVRHQVLPPDAMMVAVGQGVALPTIGQPARETPPPPQAFRPDARAATESPEGATEAPPPPRHPMDGSPAGAPAPDPTAPAFPRPDQAAA